MLPSTAFNRLSFVLLVFLILSFRLSHFYTISKHGFLGAGLVLDFKIFSVGIESTTTAGELRDSAQEDMVTSSQESSGTQGFVLADPDGGDQFDVQVFVDPVYGSFVFHTLAGASSCPSEAGTLSRFQPQLEMIQAQAAVVPPSLPAVHRIKVCLGKNDEKTRISSFLLADQPILSFLSVSILLRPHLTSSRFFQIGNKGLEPGTFHFFQPNKLGAIVRLGSLDTLGIDVTLADLPAQYTREVTLEIFSDQSSYNYTGIQVAFLAECDYANFIDNRLSLERLGAAMLTVSAVFEPPCAEVAWSGDIGWLGRFSLNKAAADSIVGVKTISVTLFNPQWNEYKWADNSRLTGIKLRYRRQGDAQWTFAEDKQGVEINARDLASSYGEKSKPVTFTLSFFT